MTPEDLSDARKLRALNGWMMRHFVRNVALACLLVLGLPRVALARSLDVTAVQIEATVKEDGSLAVVEQRTYDASGSYSGILWDVHEGVYEGRRVEAEVTTDPQEALSLARGAHDRGEDFQLVITDCRMQPLDGLEYRKWHHVALGRYGGTLLAVCASRPWLARRVA